MFRLHIVNVILLLMLIIGFGCFVTCSDNSVFEKFKMLLFKLFICLQLALYFMFGAFLYFPVQLINIKSGILNLIASTLLTTNMGVQPVVSVESDSIEMDESTETAQIDPQNVTGDAVISEMIPNAVNGLLPLIICTTTGCGTCENQTSEGGTISSPDYPQDYGNDRACIYTIRGPVDQKIHLSFKVFYVEFQYDWIDIYDGTSPHISENITIGSSLTGNDLPRDRNSTANVMTIHFVSDLDNTEIPSEHTGRWQAKYKAI